jgi:hypothetical protein
MKHAKERYTLTRMQRPIGITITAILMALNACADVVLSLLYPSVGSPHAHHGGSALSPVVIAVHLSLALLVILELRGVLYYWLGRSWARWLVLGGSVFYLTGLRFLRSQWHHSHTTAALTLGSGFLAIFLIWYLYKRDVRIWFARPLTASAK